MNRIVICQNCQKCCCCKKGFDFEIDEVKEKKYTRLVRND